MITSFSLFCGLSGHDVVMRKLNASPLPFVTKYWVNPSYRRLISFSRKIRRYIELASRVSPHLVA